jgi:polar amino acid transport system permease protein
MFINDWINWIPTMLSGLVTSLAVIAVSLVVGLPIGMLLGVGATAKSKLVSRTFAAITEIGRGIPTLVLLYLMYYGVSRFGLNLTSFVAAVAGVTVTLAAYSSELFRAGFEAVPRGESEAARALGMSSFYLYWDIIIPQGSRIALPSLIGLSIQMFQATALAYQIALPELLSQAYIVGTQTFQYLSALSLAGVIYLIISVPLSYLSQHIGTDRRGPKFRKRKQQRSTSPVPVTKSVPAGSR